MQEELLHHIACLDDFSNAVRNNLPDIDHQKINDTIEIVSTKLDPYIVKIKNHLMEMTYLTVRALIICSPLAFLPKLANNIGKCAA